METNTKINSSLKWRTLQTFSFLFLNGLFLVILARLVDKEIHGVFVILNTITVLSLLLSEAGIGSSLVQNQSLNKYHIGSGNVLAFSSSFFLYGLFVIFGPFLVKFFDGKFTYLNVLVLATNIIINSLSSIAQSLLIRNFEFKKLFLLQFFAIIVGNFCVGVPLAIMDYGIWSFIISATLTNLLYAIGLRVFTPESLVFTFRKKEMKDIFNFGAPATGIQLLSFANRQLDKLILGKLVPLNGVAIYEKAFFIAHLPSKLIGDSIDSPLFSYLSKNFYNKREQFNVLMRFFQMTGILSIMAVIILFFFPEEVIYIVLGENWIEASGILKIFSLTIPLHSFTKLIDITARSNFKLSYSFYAKVGFTIFLILGIFYGAKYGLETVTALIAMCTLIYTIIMLVIGVKILNIRPNLSDVVWFKNIKIIIALLIAQLICIYVFNNHSFIALGIIVLMDLGILIFNLKASKAFLKLSNS